MCAEQLYRERARAGAVEETEHQGGGEQIGMEDAGEE